MMKPIGIRFILSMLAAGDNRKKSLVRIVLQKKGQPNGLLIPPAFSFVLSFLDGPLVQKVTLVVRVWADQVGGGRPSCIKISYSEPTRAESREGSPALAEGSRVT